MAEQPIDPTSPGFIPVCAIGASAGGVGALQTLFRLLPDNLGLAYVVVIHLSPDHPSAMHEILGACTRMPVFQVEDGPTLRANCVYVIAPDSELVIEGNHAKARPFSDPRGHRAPIDMFFRSVAAGRGDGIAVVLTGGGSDGAIGVRAIKEAGGIVMVQEPSEAGFPSMPQNAIATGVADVIAPLARLAERIVEAVQSKEAVRSLDEGDGANDLRRIITFLRTRTGHDFSGYKRSTVLRRVSRRLQICQILSLADYAHHLRNTPEEAKELLADLLISVTMFFRDPSAFTALGHGVIRPILERMSAGEAEGELRAWVVGCATGEEAYSLAILFLEQAEHLKLHVPLQIFATDLDEGALATAREGRYPRTIEADVSAERLRRFFIDEGTHYRVSRKVRDLVLFATHSVVREPPFLRLDLVTCRNVLIYLERALQQHVCAIFHYGLKPDGYLFLGSAETADTSQIQFTAVDRDARIYRALPSEAGLLPMIVPTSISKPSQLSPVESRVTSSRFEAGEVLGASHAAALEVSAPPSALVAADHAALHLSPTAGRFILLSAGPLSGKLPSIVRPELRLDLKLALDRVFETRQPTNTRLIDVQLDGGRRRVSAHLAPVPTGEGLAARAIVYFLDNGPARAADDLENGLPPDELQHLHSELRIAQEAELAGRIKNESAVQELRASNEELQSLNEEYRSTAEELETSKEELQSMNEELQTVNAELKNKLWIISAAHNDLQNLTASSEIGTLFLDNDLRIRMFTPRVAELINVTNADVGRPVTNFTHRLDYDGIERTVRRVLRNLTPTEEEIRGLDDRWFMMRARPYRTLDDRVEGAVLTFDDITERKMSQAALLDSEARFRGLLAASSEVLYRHNPDWSEMRQLHGAGFLADTDVADPNWFNRYIPRDDQPRVRAAIEEAVRSKGVFDLEHRVIRIDGTVGWILSRSTPILDASGVIVEWFGAASDVTARREAEHRLHTLIEGIPQLVWRGLENGDWTWVSPQWCAFTGQSEEESLGKGWLTAVHPDDRVAAEQVWRDAKAGAPLTIEMRIVNVNEGRYCWFATRALPIRDRLGNVIEWLGTSTDVDDLRRLQEQQHMLMTELQHRTRNLMGVVRSTMEMTLRSSADLADFGDRYRERIDALARVQGLLSRLEGLERITFDKLVENELTAVGADNMTAGRVVMEGPAGVGLRSSTVQIFSLALHELATNAVKYGALKQPSGRLAVTWRVEPAGPDGGTPWLHVDWRESGVDMPHEGARPQGSGQGRHLIERALPYQLGAKTTYVMEPDGVRCSIAVPVTSRTATVDGGADPASAS